ASMSMWRMVGTGRSYHGSYARPARRRRASGGRRIRLKGPEREDCLGLTAPKGLEREDWLGLTAPKGLEREDWLGLTAPKGPGRVARRRSRRPQARPARRGP